MHKNALRFCQEGSVKYLETFDPIFDLQSDFMDDSYVYKHFCKLFLLFKANKLKKKFFLVRLYPWAVRKSIDG